eukprot:365091-Chlamydomonas_euryale.AAC.13
MLQGNGMCKGRRLGLALGFIPRRCEDPGGRTEAAAASRHTGTISAAFLPTLPPPEQSPGRANDFHVSSPPPRILFFSPSTPHSQPPAHTSTRPSVHPSIECSTALS